MSYIGNRIGLLEELPGFLNATRDLFLVTLLMCISSAAKAQPKWEFDELHDGMRAQIEAGAKKNKIKRVYYYANNKTKTSLLRIFEFDKLGRLKLDYETHDKGRSFYRTTFTYNDCHHVVRSEAVLLDGDQLSGDSLPYVPLNPDTAISRFTYTYAGDCLPMGKVYVHLTGAQSPVYTATVDSLADTLCITYLDEMSQQTVLYYHSSGKLVKREVKKLRRSDELTVGSFSYREKDHAYDVLEGMIGDTTLHWFRYYLDGQDRLKSVYYGADKRQLSMKFKYLGRSSRLREAKQIAKNGRVIRWYKVQYSEKNLPIKILDRNGERETGLRYRFFN